MKTKYIKPVFIAFCFLGLAFMIESFMKYGKESYSISYPLLWSFFVALTEESLFLFVFLYFKYVEKSDDYLMVIVYKLTFIFMENSIREIQVRSILFFFKNFGAHLLVHSLSLAVVFSVYYRNSILDKISRKNEKFYISLEFTLLALAAILPHWLFNWSVSYYTLHETKIYPIYFSVFLGFIGLSLFTYLIFSKSKKEELLN